MQQIEEVKRGQVVCYRTNGVYTYGLVLGYQIKNFRKCQMSKQRVCEVSKQGYIICVIIQRN